MNHLVEIKNIQKIFYSELGKVEAIKDLSFNLNKGEIIGIVGPSGSGKSTILNLISGLIEPTRGDVTVDGSVGYMFQKDHLLEWRNVLDNVLIGLEIKKEKTCENIERVIKLLDKYGLSEFKNNFPLELSGGMRQRIALIRTLALNPNILLLDEPFSALDYQTRLEVCNDVYKIIKDQEISAILVTHDISEAISMCDKVVVLSRRPSTIKNIFDLTDVFGPDLTPISIRKHPLFSKYFDLIWQSLGDTSEKPEKQ